MITVTILTKNSQKYLFRVLESAKQFDEVLIYDTGSTDETLKIASQYPNSVIHNGPLKGFGPTHNQASHCATNDWILSLDSDEIITAELVDEIRSLELDPNTVYSFPRHNYYKGKFIKWCGWYPDRQIRLYHRKTTRFTEAHVHERVMSDGLKHQYLKNPIIHYSYEKTDDFLEKMQSYSNLFAQQHTGKKSSSLFKAIIHGLFAFIKSYFFKRGFLGGQQGFEISIYNANTAFYKYLKLMERNRLFPKLTSVEKIDDF